MLALLYGCGLRISEASSVTRAQDAADRRRDALTVTGKGSKTRMVPVLPAVVEAIASYIALCPCPLPPDGPLFLGVKGGPLSPRIIQLAVERLRGALGLPDIGDAARAAPLLRDASARARRRSARDPGTARPRLALDDADLHRRRRDPPDGRVEGGASAGALNRPERLRSHVDRALVDGERRFCTASASVGWAWQVRARSSAEPPNSISDRRLARSARPRRRR